MNQKERANQIVRKQMLAKDAFSQWLGIEVLEVDLGKSKLQMTVRKEMTNGFNIAHGGITYSLSDSALAFACNSDGRRTVSVETSISHTTAVQTGDVLTAEASEESKTNKIGIYRVLVTNQHNQRVAVFKGVVYRTSKEWPVEE